MNLIVSERPFPLSTTESLQRFLNPTKILAAILLVTASCSVAAVLISTNGSISASSAFLVCIVVVFLSFYRLEWGFCLLMGAILLLDQTGWPGRANI